MDGKVGRPFETHRWSDGSSSPQARLQWHRQQQRRSNNRRRSFDGLAYGAGTLTASTEAADTRRSYDLVASEYAAHIADELNGKPLDRALLNAIVELAAGGPICDLGCGPGHVAAYLSGRGAEVIGLDLSPSMCGLARDGISLPFCAADMTALPIRSQSLSAIVSLYAVIHLTAAARTLAYFEFARSLRVGGYALIAFHTSDADVPVGGQMVMDTWWGHHVALTFRYLDPASEIDILCAAGLTLVAQLDRAAHPGVEHPSRRSYLLVERS